MVSVFLKIEQFVNFDVEQLSSMVMVSQDWVCLALYMQELFFNAF